jgi:hypothetical protein
VAGDLIPPPSPARRSDPGAEPKATAELEEATHLAADAASSGSYGPSPFRSRFGFLFGALAGIALCAAGGFALLLATRESDGPRLAENWSAWQPETSRMADGALEIAEHVGGQYKQEGGSQLVQITSTPLEIQGEEIGVAVRPKGSSLEKLEGPGLLYILDGLGDDGAVATGAPSKKRGRLLMREALELALYSFRYLDDVTMVAVLIPQAAAQSPTEAPEPRRAVFYRPGDLLPQLEIPLARTLSPKTPTTSSMTTAESNRVDSLTLRNVFLASIRPLDPEQNYLVLVEPDTIE